MLIPLFLLVSQGFTTSPAVPATATDDPPVRVWFNSDGNYAHGDRAKVYAKSAEDAYLIVLRVDGAGRVRVLFPLDPPGDQRITGGKKYELKGRGGREAFIADDTVGHGTVLAAVSKSPFRVDAFVQNGRWSSRALSGPDVRDDPESGLLNLVQRMKTSSEEFHIGVATYVVSEQYSRRLYPYGDVGPGWGYDPWWGYRPRVGLGLWYGPRYYHGYRRGWPRW
jgi:hypothetical protein